MLIRDSGFLLGARHVGIFCRACIKIPGSQKETGVQHELCCLYKMFRHSQSLSQILRRAGALPKAKFPDPSHGPPRQQTLLRTAVSGLLSPVCAASSLPAPQEKRWKWSAWVRVGEMSQPSGHVDKGPRHLPQMFQFPGPWEPCGPSTFFP